MFDLVLVPTSPAFLQAIAETAKLDDERIFKRLQDSLDDPASQPHVLIELRLHTLRNRFEADVIRRGKEIISGGRHRWTSREFAAVAVYCNSLLGTVDTQPRALHRKLAESINRKFAYNMVLYGQCIPPLHLFGQRQSWYDTLFAEKKAERISKAHLTTKQ